MRSRILIAAFFLAAAHCAGAQAVRLNGLAHIAFRVSDLEKAKEFYSRLGFESPFQFTDDGKVTEAFVKINDDQFVELYPHTQPTQKIGLTHVCFGTDDIEQVRAAYAQRGLTPPEAKKGRAGNVLFSLHDPEGALVEYSQYLPGSLHSLDRGKHQGERIATRLQRAIESVKDPAAERTFYSKLGLEETAEPATLRVPGAGKEELSFRTGDPGSTAEVVFEVENLKRTQKALKDRKLNPQREHGLVSVRDPDGNVIVFEVNRSAH